MTYASTAIQKPSHVRNERAFAAVEIVDDVGEKERHRKRNDADGDWTERRRDRLAADDVAEQETRDEDGAEIDDRAWAAGCSSRIDSRQVTIRPDAGGISLTGGGPSTGNTMRNSAPFPAGLATYESSPPCSMAMRCAIARPSPVPCDFSSRTARRGARSISVRDAGPVVAHADADSVRAERVEHHADVSLRVGIVAADRVERVLHEVREDLNDLIAIGASPWGSRARRRRRARCFRRAARGA